MIKGTLLLGLLAIGLANPVLASSAREIGQSELRQAASLGKTISLKSTLTSVSRYLQASVLDARAFEADGVYYRLILKRPNGELLSVIVNAQTGHRVAPDSSVGRQVTEAAMLTARTDFSTRRP